MTSKFLYWIVVKFCREQSAWMVWCKRNTFYKYKKRDDFFYRFFEKIRCKLDAKVACVGNLSKLQQRKFKFEQILVPSSSKHNWNSKRKCIHQFFPPIYLVKKISEKYLSLSKNPRKWAKQLKSQKNVSKFVTNWFKMAQK